MAKTKEYYQNWWKSPRGRYHRHIANAKLRGVVFRLTFDEWWSIWEASGRWDQRGRGRGQYVMARTGDQGAYEPGNVRICLASENLSERNAKHPMPFEKASARAKAGWANVPPEERARLMGARARKRVGYSHSDKTLAKLRAAARVALPRRSRNEQGQWASPDEIA